MRSFDDSFLDRDDAALSAMLDKRVDMLAGLRVENFAAGANLKMTVPVAQLDRWRKGRHKPLGIVASVSAAVRWALEKDPLFAALFDGRDELLVPRNPSIGVGFDAGEMAEVMVVRGGEYSSPIDLAEKLEPFLRKKPSENGAGFRGEPKAKVSSLRKKRRWLKMVNQELRERFDYLLSPLQKKRFSSWADQRGHIQVHNLGSHGVQEFKGFLRRPWVSMVWALKRDTVVCPDDSGGFISKPVMPIILVYAQELIPVDRACAFLSNVVEVLSDPERYLEG